MSDWELNKGNLFSQGSEAQIQTQAVIPKAAFFTFCLNTMIGEVKMFNLLIRSTSYWYKLRGCPNIQHNIHQSDPKDGWLDSNWTKKLKLSSFVVLCEKSTGWQKEGRYSCFLYIKRILI